MSETGLKSVREGRIGTKSLYHQIKRKPLRRAEAVSGQERKFMGGPLRKKKVRGVAHLFDETGIVWGGGGGGGGRSAEKARPR